VTPANDGEETSGREGSGQEGVRPKGGPPRRRPDRPGVTFDPQLSGASGPLETLTFEELVAALERVAARLAGGELGIEAAADLYEQAELLYGAAQERLAAVEERIERLNQGPQGTASPQ
jgi:exodeoxyribonuclease VII small subunit